MPLLRLQRLTLTYRAVANAVYNNVVSSQLQLLPFTDAQRTALLTSALDTLDTLSSSEKRMATEVLADGLRKVYIMFTVIAGTTLVCAFFIQVRPGPSFHAIVSLFPSMSLRCPAAFMQAHCSFIASVDSVLNR